VALAILLGIAACGDDDPLAPSDDHAVAADVLFLVLGKMALYDQSPSGELSLRNHHFVAEIMPKAGRTILSGTLSRSLDPRQVLEFEAEGNAFLAHGARVMDPVELHELHPDGEYVISFETESGRMEALPLTLTKRPSVEGMPAAAAVVLNQGGTESISSAVDPDADLVIGWESMPGNTRVIASDLDDLIFVLAFDCFGNNVAHSGRPYQGGPYLTYEDSEYTVASENLEPGLSYTVIVEQATADVEVFRGVPAIATYATLTFVTFQTAGEPESSACPASGQ
jgi:hypothetical protein